MKITEYKTTEVEETFTSRRYLQWREQWGRLVLTEDIYSLMFSVDGELVLTKTFENRPKARKFALKYATKTKGVRCFTIMKNSQIIERMEV